MSSIQVLVTLVDGESGKILFDGQVATIPLELEVNVGTADNTVLLNEIYKRLGVVNATANTQDQNPSQQGT